MIRYLRHTEINKKKWDALISGSPVGIIYAASWYLDIVCPNWEALVEDDYSAVFPLTCRSKFGIHYLFQPYFTQQLGLFSNEKEKKENILRDFLMHIPKKFRLIEIQLNTDNLIEDFNGFSTHKKLTHHLFLGDDYVGIRSNYSENHSRNIKKAIKTKNEIITDIAPSAIIQLFRENKGAGIENLKSADYLVFEKLLNEASQKNLLEVRGVRNESQELIAGAIFLQSLHSYIFLFSATNKEAKESGAMSQLIDSFIRDHSEEEVYLDFEGSMDLNLARFYKGFGSKEVVYLQIRKNNLPGIIRWLK